VTGAGGGKVGEARILVIDDEPVVLRAFRRILEPPHRVVIAEGGAAGIGILERDLGFDVILCDMSMPGVDGAQVFRYLEQVEPRLLSRLVFSTGGAFTEAAQRFLRAVDNHIVEKPLTPSELREAVDQVLGRSTGHHGLA
jgi:CheY-like chemotaxis protein